MNLLFAVLTGVAFITIMVAIYLPSKTKDCWDILADKITEEGK